MADISNGLLTLAEYLITYLEDGNYQGNIVKKMTISPDLDTSVIASNADKNPHLDVVTNMQFKGFSQLINKQPQSLPL